MPRPPSSSSDRPRWLRFEAGEDESKILFGPGADWRKSSQYSVVKPLDGYRREDSLRLAKELLHRSQRYRWQTDKLGAFGIKSLSLYKKSLTSFYASDRPLPTFPGWQDYPLPGHKCEPTAAKDCGTLGAYIAAQESARLIATVASSAISCLPASKPPPCLMRNRLSMSGLTATSSGHASSSWTSCRTLDLNAPRSSRWNTG